MPKILDDINIKILEEAKKQVFQKGYQNMTIRSVAIACGIATGTIYNYYVSKEALVASFVLIDWIPLYEELKKKCDTYDRTIQVCEIIYEGLLSFQEDYQILFKQDEAIRTANKAMPTQHPILRRQLAALLQSSCSMVRVYKKAEKEFLPEFLAEILLGWSTEGKSFSQLKPFLEAMTQSIQEVEE